MITDTITISKTPPVCSKYNLCINRFQYLIKIIINPSKMVVLHVLHIVVIRVFVETSINLSCLYQDFPAPTGKVDRVG